MGEYKRNKFRTAGEIYRDIENWPTAFSMRMRQSKAGLRLLNFRNGLNVCLPQWHSRLVVGYP